MIQFAEWRSAPKMQRQQARIRGRPFTSAKSSVSGSLIRIQNAFRKQPSKTLRKSSLVPFTSDSPRLLVSSASYVWNNCCAHLELESNFAGLNSASPPLSWKRELALTLVQGFDSYHIPAAGFTTSTEILELASLGVGPVSNSCALAMSPVGDHEQQGIR